MSDAKHWSQLQEAGAQSGIRIMFAIYRIFGRIPFRLLLFPVVLYFYFGRTAARKASHDYLRKAQQQGLIHHTTTVWWLGYRHFVNFGESLLDKLAVWVNDIRLDDIDFHNRVAIERIIDTGRGGLIIGSHLGNLEVCRALAMQKPDVRMNVFVHTEHATTFNAMLKKAGSESQVNLLPISSINPATATLLHDKIEAGEFIVIAGDRTPPSGNTHTAVVDFLGASAKLPYGPYILASILKCPVLTLFCLRKEQSGRTRYDLYFDDFAEQIKLPRKNKQQGLSIYCQQFAERLEQYCAKAPLQWYNFYPFWCDYTSHETP